MKVSGPNVFTSTSKIKAFHDWVTDKEYCTDRELELEFWVREKNHVLYCVKHLSISSIGKKVSRFHQISRPKSVYFWIWHKSIKARPPGPAFCPFPWKFPLIWVGIALWHCQGLSINDELTTHYLSISESLHRPGWLFAIMTLASLMACLWLIFDWLRRSQCWLGLDFGSHPPTMPAEGDNLDGLVPV